jgi:hypothetical protein
MKSDITKDTTELAAMGIAALLPGMVHAHEKLGKEIEHMRGMLNSLQHPVKRGRPPASAKADPEPRPRKTRKKAKNFGWNGMSPEERKEEMRRRVALGKSRKARHHKKENEVKAA